MAWVRRPRGRGAYYVRCRWVDGRCVQEYVGRGPAAQLVADHDRLARLQREAAKQAWESDEARAYEAWRRTRELNEAVGLVARAALVAAGYHRHKQGSWRRRRGRDGRVPAGRRRGQGLAEGAGRESQRR